MDGEPEATGLEANAAETDVPPEAVPPIWRSGGHAHEHAAAARKRASKGERRFVIGALFLALVGVLIAFLLWLRPLRTPYFAGIFVTNAASPQIPVAAYLAEDQAALEGSNLFPLASQFAFTNQDRHTMELQLIALQLRSFWQPVVLYVAAPAGLAPDGSIVLFPSDFRPGDFRTALPLKEVFGSLATCPARHKLLILDIFRPVADGQFGVLADDLASRIAVQADSFRDRHLLVLCACSPGQVAQTSSTLGRSIFNFYFVEGLSGRADGALPDQPKDGRVSVKELAAFLAAHVDRWSMHNRNTRQTPMLLGQAEDFDLISIAAPPPIPDSTEPVAVVPYPKWLRAGWELHDEWWAAGHAREVPHLVRQLEVELLRIERRHWEGDEAASIEVEVKALLGNAKERLQQNTAVAQPEPRSLALAVAQGKQADAALRTELKQLVARVESIDPGLKPEDAEKLRAKPLGEFIEKLKGKTDVDLALAVVEAVSLDSALTPDRIIFLDQLLRSQQAKPRFVETAYLQKMAQRLAALASSPPGARTVGPNQELEVLRRGFDVVRRGEQAASKWQTFTWLEPLLDPAMQKRHDGEIALWSSGYADLAAADEQLQQALAELTTITAAQAAVEHGLRGLAEAVILLPDSLNYVAAAPDLRTAWLRVATATGAMVQALAVVGAAQPPTLENLAKQTGQWERAAANLADAMTELRQPFATESVRHLVARATAASAGGAVLLEVEALLQTPLLKAADREALWNARQALADRLNAAIRAADQEDDRRDRPFAPLGEFEAHRELYESRESQRGLIRAMGSVALLKLSGYAPEAVRRLEAQLKSAVKEPNESAWLDAVNRDLIEAWYVALPAQAEQETNLRRRLYLTWFLPPFFPLAILDTPASNPAVQFRVRELAALWAWQADRFDYETHDLGRTEFLLDAAREYQRFRSPAAPDNYLSLAHTGTLNLTPLQPSALGQLQLELFGAAAERPPVSVVRPTSPALKITIDTSSVPTGPGRVWNIPFRVAIDPAAGPLRPAPAGLLLEARIAGRSFHHLLPLPTLAQWETDPFVILLSTNSGEPQHPLSDLLLRPLKGPKEAAPTAEGAPASPPTAAPAPPVLGPTVQRLYAYVRNPSARPRKLLLELRAHQSILGRALLALGPGEIKKANFSAPAAPAPAGAAPAAPAPAPGPELNPLDGPIEFRLLDPENQEATLLVQSYPVGVAPARSYVNIAGVQFAPASTRTRGRNRLTVDLIGRASLGAVPCPVQLVVPPDRVPGLLSASEGTFDGVIETPGQPVSLFADNLRLQEGTPDLGHFYVNVDGRERAFVFQASFARHGDPTTPREDLTPALRLRADRYAQAGPSYRVTVEVDSPPAESTLEVALGRVVGGGFEADAVQSFPQARETRVRFSPFGPEGALLFEAVSRDWTVRLNTTGILGERRLRARLLNRAGIELLSVSQAVSLDNSIPVRVKFLDLPAQAKRGTPLVVEASGRDTESGIREVNFFLGRPMDGKLPPNTPLIKAVPTSADRATWTAKVPLPDDRKGPIDLSVQMVNNVGLGAFATESIELLETDPINPGLIHGKLVEGAIPQAGIDVTLHDEKGAEKARTTTGADGNFRFGVIPPGKYELRASKAVSNRKATKSIVVEAGKPLDVTLELFL